MTQKENKPPFILSQGLRLLLETERPERFLRPEYFRVGRSAGAAADEQDTGTWVAVDRFAVAHNRVCIADNDPCDLSRLVITTDAGVGKTTVVEWLEAELNQPDSVLAAFLIPFGRIPSRPDDLLKEVLVPRLLHAFDQVDETPSQEDTAQVLHNLRREGRLVLLLDALDQAPADGSAATTLRTILDDPAWQSCRIVISGRPHALQRHWNNLFATEHGLDWRFVQVDEFDPQQQRIYLGTNEDDRHRVDLIPDEAREILATPRVLKYLRDLPDAELKQIKTAGDVYWHSINHLLVEGMRGSWRARQIGLAADELVPANVQRRSLRRAMRLLSAIAFEMTATQVVRTDAATGDQQSVPNFDGVRRSRFARFCEQLQRRLSTESTVETGPLLDRDLDALDALNDFVSQGLFDTVEGLQEIFWRNRTLQEFFAAYWLAQYCTPDDANKLCDWLYLPEQPLSEEYYWVWRFLCEMHEDARDPEAWTRAVEPIYRPGDGTVEGTKRSGELVYRAWKPLGELVSEGEAAARNVRDRFLGEFETEVLSGNRGAEVIKIAEQFRDNFIEVPAGEFRMGSPPEKQDTPDLQLRRWEDFMEKCGDPAARAKKFLSDWIFPAGKRGEEERQEQIEWWTRVFHEHDVKAVLERNYPRHETPAEPIQQVDGFLLACWPTINAWYRLFSPGHGKVDSYYGEKYANVSSATDTPAIFVSWYDAWSFATWTHWDGQSCRLPREHEWEYAAKAGTAWDQDYWWGDEFGASKCNGDQQLDKTTPPSSAHENPWGFQDILGNVWEWCQDEYRRVYDREAPADSPSRVLRGGSWFNLAYGCRSAFRRYRRCGESGSAFGFRVARAESRKS